jgi:hypothetical protein
MSKDEQLALKKIAAIVQFWKFGSKFQPSDSEMKKMK